MPNISQKTLDDIYAQIGALQNRVEYLANNTAPTLPVYDSSNWPQDAIEGQVTIAQNSTGAYTLWVFKEGVWQEVGSLNIQHEVIDDPTGVLVVPNTSTFLPWFHDSDDSLIAVGGTAPTINADGTYAITVFASGGVGSADYDLTMNLRATASGPRFESFVTSARWNASGISGVGPTISATKPLLAGDVIDVRVSHNASTNELVVLHATITKF